VKINLRIRIWIEDKLEVDETRAVEHGTGSLDRLANEHLELIGGRRHMIEIEFLDEPDLQKRFFQMGTDPDRMVQPIAVDPTKKRTQ
jgi:hypothetical protein